MHCLQVIRVHMIGNEMDTNPHLGIQSKSGSMILAEGNHFINYKNVSLLVLLAVVLLFHD